MYPTINNQEYTIMYAAINLRFYDGLGITVNLDDHAEFCYRLIYKNWEAEEQHGVISYVPKGARAKEFINELCVDTKIKDRFIETQNNLKKLKSDFELKTMLHKHCPVELILRITQEEKTECVKKIEQR